MAKGSEGFVPGNQNGPTERADIIQFPKTDEERKTLKGRLEATQEDREQADYIRDHWEELSPNVKVQAAVWMLRHPHFIPDSGHTEEEYRQLRESIF